jgi:hypothetical protein
MVRFTHGFHALTRVLFLPLIVGVFFSGSVIADALSVEPTRWLIGVWLVVTAIVLILVDKTLLEPLSTLLYLRLSRRTPVNWGQARRYSSLLTGEQWYPMKELNHLPREQRVPFVEQMYARHGG